MSKFVNSVIVSVVVALCVGCAASGPKFSEVANSFPPLPQDEGRIFIYRSGTPFGSAVQPDVKLDGEKIGSSQPGGFFYIDRPSGHYEISVTTEVKRTLALLVEKGEQKFVRLNISMGFFVGHVYPELIDREKAEKEIQNCHYTGKDVLKPEHAAMIMSKNPEL